MSRMPRPMSHFEFLDALLVNTLRDNTLLSRLPDEMHDLTGGGCLLVASSLMQQSMSALKNASMTDYFPESQIVGVFDNDKIQHFATRFTLQGKMLYACGYGITNEDTLKSAVARDMHRDQSNGLSVTPVTYKEAKSLADAADTPVPSELQRALYSKSITDSLNKAPKYAVYAHSDTLRLSAPRGYAYKSAADPMRVIKQSFHNDAERGTPPFKISDQFVVTLGVYSPNDLLPADDDNSLSETFTIKPGAMVDVLNAYEVSASGSLNKLTLPDIEAIYEDSLTQQSNAYYTAPAMTK